MHVRRAHPTPSLHRDTRSCTSPCSVSRKTYVLTTLISKTSFPWYYLKCLATPRCASSCRLEYFKPDSNRTVKNGVSNFRRFRFSNASHLTSVVTPQCAASCWFQYFKPGSNRTVNKKVTNFRRFWHLRLNDIFANKSIQICQKVTGRDKNLESRPSTLHIPSAYEKIKISDLRHRLVGFYSWPHLFGKCEVRNRGFWHLYLGGPRRDECRTEGCVFL